MQRLEGKTAAIFGAGVNIGGTVAHFLACEGAQVAISDIAIKAAEECAAFINSEGFEAIALEGSATEESSVEDIIAKTTSHYGRLDIVFNMAGKVHWSPVLDMDMEEWRECVMSFPTAGMLTTKYGARAMIENGRQGSIIHLLSTAAHFGEAAGTAYTAAKGALLNFARSAAMDLAHAGIRVNTITPCAMEHQLWTKMSEEILDAEFDAPDRLSFYSRDDYLKNIPLGRFPRASDLAWAAVFLASDEAAFLTGVDLPVDGGLRHKYPAWRPGDFSGANIEDYANEIRITRYGLEQEPLSGEIEKARAAKKE